jgi:uncharacterized protein
MTAGRIAESSEPDSGMKIVVAQISEDEGLSFHHLYPDGEPDLLGGEGHLVGRSEVTLRATRADKKVELIGNLTAVVGCECDRCLKPLSVPVERSFELLYMPPLKAGEEKELGEEDLSIGFYQGETIDLDDLVREQIELTLPMARLCGEECAGLCPDCGANLNDYQCDCRKEQVDSRWTALTDLKSKLN